MVMVMVTAELPDDVIKDILLWLPVKSLMRFKCVNKSWCALIRNHSFIEQHSALRPDATQLLLPYSRQYHEQIILTTDPNGNGGATMDPIPPNILEHGPFNLSCCHGLISMHPSSLSEAKGNNTFVYNPNTREALSIPFNANAFEDYYSVRSYIGFEPVSDQYKLMIFGAGHKHAYGTEHCEIITLGGRGTNNYNWRQVVINGTLPIRFGDTTCLNGALYWISFDSQSVVVFHLQSDKFQTILSPKQGIRSDLCQLRGRLTLVYSEVCGARASLELWTLKDCYSQVWVKESLIFSLTVPEDCYYLSVVGSMNQDEILIALKPQVYAVYNMKIRKGRKISIEGDNDKNFLEKILLYTQSMRCY